MLRYHVMLYVCQSVQCGRRCSCQVNDKVCHWVRRQHRSAVVLPFPQHVNMTSTTRNLIGHVLKMFATVSNCVNFCNTWKFKVLIQISGDHTLRIMWLSSWLIINWLWNCTQEKLTALILCFAHQLLRLLFLSLQLQLQVHRYNDLISMLFRKKIL